MGLLRLFLASLAVLGLSGCGTTYLYSGSIDAADSVGTPRKVTVHWTKTERPFGYDSASSTVALRTECSDRVINFVERNDGIVFVADPEDREAWTGQGAAGGICGRIDNAPRVTLLKEEPLSLTILCKPRSSESAMPGRSQAYLEASKIPYQIPIRREATNKVPDLPCREP